MRPPWLENPALKTPRRVDSVASLKQLQEVMSVALYRPLTDEEGMMDTWTDDRPMSQMAETFIKPNDRLTSFDRLEIYNRVYWFRILNGLTEDYPGLRALLGDRRFDALSQAYLTAYPSGSWTLRNLGSRLVNFIQAEPRLTRPKTAQAVDVARMEWAQTLAFDEAARPSVKGDDLLGVPPAELHLDLQPYLVLLDLHCAADEFVHEAKKLGNGLRSEASNVTDHAPERHARKPIAKLRKEDVWVAVHRSDNMIFFKRIEREAFLLLTALRDGCSLLEALDKALAGASPEVDWAARLREWFDNWARLGWLCERRV